MSRVVAIGEVLVELSRGEDGRYGLAFGSDAFTTAIHLARLGVATAFATALGDDPYSQAIVQLAETEGLATDLIVHVAGRRPGLVMVETAESGGRLAFDWREAAPSRRLFALEGWGSLAEAITAARLVYLTGHTLSLYDNAGIGRLLATLEVARQRGALVAFDSAFHPQSWGGDVARARAVFIEALRRVDIALAGYAGAALLFGDVSPAATLARLAACGVGEVAVRADSSIHLLSGGEAAQVPPGAMIEAPEPAGEAFSAAYLAGRLGGRPPLAAAEDSFRLAAEAAARKGAGKSTNGTANGPIKGQVNGQIPVSH